MKLQALHRRLDAATSTSISTSIATAAATTSTPALTSTSTLAAVGKGASPKAPVHRDSSSGKQYSPVTRSKIAALLRKSVQEVRQSDETNSPALTPVAPMGKESSTAQPAPGARFHIACLDKLHEALRKLREEICPTKEPRAAVNANLSATATTRRKASFTYGEIDRNIEVCARSEDLFEMVGWYQQKIRLLTQDFLEDSQQQDDFLRFGGGGAKADSADRGDSGASTTSPLHIWEDLQLFLDNIKCSVRASSTTRASIERGTHSPDIVQRILSTLNEIALLLMSAKSSAKSVYIERLQGTVDHQNEVLERSEERIEELRDKVREYGQEIAALESRNEEQRVALAYHRTTGERLVAMERQKSELEREKADSDSKIARMQAYIDHLRETVAGLEATRHRTMQLADTASHNRANLAHTSFLETDSEESVEMEQKRKAGGGSGGGGSLTPHSAGSTSARQAARKQAHENSRGSPEHSLAAADAIVAQLGRLTISDWIETYLYSRDSSTIEKIMETEALMAGTWADLEAALEKLKYANTEVKLCLLAKKGHIERTAKAASKAGAAKKDDQNLCCICQEEVKSILLMPCRHLCVCQVCSEGAPVVHPPRSPRSQAHQRPRMLQSCPMCRATVTECLRVYA